MSNLDELVEQQRLAERRKAWAVYEQIRGKAERGGAIGDKEVQALRQAQETLGPRLAEIDADGSLVGELSRCQTLADGFDAAQAEAQEAVTAMADAEKKFEERQKALNTEREKTLAPLQQACGRAESHQRASRDGRSKLAGHDRRRRAIVHDVSIDTVLARDHQERLQAAGPSVHGPSATAGV